jgi:hypothetical protein
MQGGSRQAEQGCPDPPLNKSMNIPTRAVKTDFPRILQSKSYNRKTLNEATTTTTKPAGFEPDSSVAL